jgi:hypothetical protein
MEFVLLNCRGIMGNVGMWKRPKERKEFNLHL